MKLRKLVGALAAVGAIGYAGTALSHDVVAYDAIPSPQPSNVPSIGNEAYSQDEIGDHIRFSGPKRILSSVTVLMSSWACEQGAWELGTCSTTPGANFSHPITLTIYAVDKTGGVPAVGAQIAAMTRSFDIPYRPSADAGCTGLDAGKWMDASGACFNGLATPITFTFVGNDITLPDEVIYGISYNTRTAGSSPLGVSGPYDSLNVGLASTTPSVGTDVDPDAVFWDTSVCAGYADGGAGGCDTFRRDTNWAPYTPTVRFKMLAARMNAIECKKDGWKALSRADGTLFKNQGDCVSYVQNGK